MVPLEAIPVDLVLDLARPHIDTSHARDLLVGLGWLWSYHKYHVLRVRVDRLENPLNPKTMEIFTQKDPRWAGLPLGTSPYQMGPYGCLTTAHAQALALAGYAEDPGTTVTKLNEVQAYTDANYIAGPGLLLWYKVANAFPQYHFRLDTAGCYVFVQVLISQRFVHWVLKVGDTYYDPLMGSTAGELHDTYKPTGKAYSADIDPAPVTVPIHFDITIQAPLGSAYVRTEPHSASPIKTSYPNGTHMECVSTVTGDKVTIRNRLGIPIASSDKWYEWVEGGFVSAAVSVHN